jgi:hypothetical protein
MPSAETILTGLTAIANDWRGLAIGWHAWLAVLGVALAGGWRPSIRTAGSLLAAPLTSVSALAWASGNPFNGLTIGALTVVLVVALFHASNEPIRFDSASWLARGGALIVFGAIYPHFVRADSPAAYVIAAPFGLLPCPTLAVVIGTTVALANLNTGPWSAALLAAGSLYGTVGVFWLGVQLDWGLFVGTALLGAKVVPESTAAHGSSRRSHA